MHIIDVNEQIEYALSLIVLTVRGSAGSNKNFVERRYALNKETSAFHTVPLTTHWNCMNIKAYQIAVNVSLKPMIY